MAEISETSLAFDETASPGTIRQMEGTERESRTWRAHHAQEGSRMTCRGWCLAWDGGGELL
jgi:hypothetical protein